MAQTYHQVSPEAMLAKNLKVNSLASESIMLENIPALGFRNINVGVINYSGSTMSAIALYGSFDGVIFQVVSGFSTFSVAVGAMGSASVVANFPLYRVSTTGAAVVDVWFVATT